MTRTERQKIYQEILYHWETRMQYGEYRLEPVRGKQEIDLVLLYLAKTDIFSLKEHTLAVNEVNEIFQKRMKFYGKNA